MGPMRYIIIGAGAVGGVVAAKFAQRGHNVLVVARGAHGQAIRDRGLVVRQPAGEAQLSLACVAEVSQAVIGANDIVLLAVKSQDLPPVIDALRGVHCAAVACLQNGVAAEPMAADIGVDVLAVMSWIPAVHLEPGVVEVFADRPAGGFRIGLYPEGQHPRAVDFARDLIQAGFDAAAVPSAMAWKHGKLLANLGNVLDAYVEPGVDLAPIVARAVAEGARTLQSAGIPFMPHHELVAEMTAHMAPGQTISGAGRPGGSTWQSASRGRPTEERYLNGWISDLAQELGASTPVNDALSRLGDIADGARSVSAERLAAWIAAVEA